jgi:hypothetical protein
LDIEEGKMESEPTPTQDGVYCNICGQLNPAGRERCEKCGAILIKPGERVDERVLARRPGCVTAFAVLTGISGVMGIIVGIFYCIGMLANRTSGGAIVGFVLMIGTFILGVLYMLLAKGLWDLRNWARLIIIALYGLGVIGNILSICGILFLSSTSARGEPTEIGTSIVGSIIGLAVGGYIIYWFVTNRDYFR